MKFADRVQQTTSTSGTGAYIISPLALAGFTTFAACYADGATVPYCVSDGTDFEVGSGTYSLSENTITRGTILSSSNSGAAVDWPAGDKSIFVTLPSAKIKAIEDEPLLAQLRSGLLVLLDGTVDASGTPIDKTGGFAASKVGALASVVLTDGPWSGRTGFALNGTDAAVSFSDEELRLTGAMTIVFIGKLDASADLASKDYCLASATGTGETLQTNELFLLKHAGSYSGAFFTFQEYGGGVNLEGAQKPASAGKDVWYYLAASRDTTGVQWNLSLWTSAAGWVHSYILHSRAGAKNTTGNVQEILFFNEAVGSLYYKGQVAGCAFYNRALSRQERMLLKDCFFSL